MKKAVFYVLAVCAAVLLGSSFLKMPENKNGIDTKIYCTKCGKEYSRCTCK